MLNKQLLDGIRKVIQAIHDENYFVLRWEQVKHKKPLEEYTSLKEVLEPFQLFWEALPDSPAIHRAPFTAICALAEEYCFGTLTGEEVPLTLSAVQVTPGMDMKDVLVALLAGAGKTESDVVAAFKNTCNFMPNESYPIDWVILFYDGTYLCANLLSVGEGISEGEGEVNQPSSPHNLH